MRPPGRRGAVVLLVTTGLLGAVGAGHLLQPSRVTPAAPPSATATSGPTAADTASRAPASRSPQPGPATPSAAATAVRLRGDIFPDGTPYVLAPDLRSAGSLGRPLTSVPEVVDLAGPVVSLTGDDGVGDRRLWLVHLRKVSSAPARYVPVALTPSGRLALVGGVSLGQVLTPSGPRPPHIGPATLTRYGRSAVFAQPSAVVLVDAATGATRRLAVPDPALERAGWTAAGTRVVASSASASWLVEPGSGRVRPLPAGAHAGHDQLVTPPVGGLWLRSWDAYGRRSARDVPVAAPVSRVRGETAANIEGWAAAAAELDAEKAGVRASTAAGYSALVAVHSDEPHNRRMLLVPRGEGGHAQVQPCCEPLAWVSGRHLLFRAVQGERVWLLVWNIGAGEVLRIAELRGASGPVAVAVAAL